MSFMGSIGNIMAESGLEDLWETVYAKGSVVHMVTGHAYLCALRAHFLTQSALVKLLLQNPDCLKDVDTERLKVLYEALLGQEQDADDAVDEPCMKQISEIIEKLCENTADKDRTAKLWINYIKQVSIIRLFLHAERTGHWELHLYAVRQMFPYFHAAGHLAYAKSAHLYIQQMMELWYIMPEKEHQQFTQEGYFTVRRSDKFWGGIFTDQTIEQFLMRQLKTSGGLTHGRGITDSTLTKWVHALSQCIPICNALETFAGVHTSTSEQHKDLRPASQSRDMSDLQTLVQWLEAHPPFASDRSDILYSIATGIVADSSVNCDDALQIGQSAMEQMTGKTYADVTLHRKDRVKSISAMKNTIKVRGEDVVINPSLMFNRMTCILNTSTELETFLEYELAPQPTSLFLKGLMRKTEKSALGNALKSLVECQGTNPDDAEFVVDGGYLLHTEDVVINPLLMFNRMTCILNTSTELETFLEYELAPQPTSLFLKELMRKTEKSALGNALKSLVECQGTNPDDAEFVVDGGYLLHTVVWPQAPLPATYQDVCNAYTNYTIKHYSTGATVVFDGYQSTASTKAAEQVRRAKHSTSADIVVAPNLPTTDFLRNSKNKSRLIQLLSAVLRLAGITVKLAESDADTLIVLTAIEVAESNGGSPVVVVGTDTDLLVMLVAFATAATYLYMLCDSKPTTVYNVKQLQNELGITAKHILFVHAITGCDTTSAVYGQGKLKAFKLAQKADLQLSALMGVFSSQYSSHGDVACAGEKIILKLYGAGKFPTLNNYRHVAYKRSVAKTSTENPFKMESLLPTSEAAKQHSYRSYHQVQQWYGHTLLPTDWGWKHEAGTLVPIGSDQPAAPQKLLKLVSCGCQTGCGNACGCRKGGEACSNMCLHCMGETCSNTAAHYLDDQDNS